MEYYATIKNNEFMPFVGTWMNPETIIFTHGWVLNNENAWTQGGEHLTLGSVGGASHTGVSREWGIGEE